MGAFDEALYDTLTGDATLAALLATYEGAAAVFTTDPAPEDATLPYIVTAGAVAQTPYDTKDANYRGRTLMRDVRCYADADGSAATVEAIAERVRALLHRQAITVEDWAICVAECMGPIAADEPDAYGRVVTIRWIVMEAEDGS
jgi:hypothetical protein